MKTLIVTGFPCPPSAWRKIFPDESAHIFSFAEALGAAGKSDLIAIARTTSELIQKVRPELLVLHDFGTTTGLMALLRARKKSQDISPRVVIFNGAFRGFDVTRAPHPLKMQFTSANDMRAAVEASGGEVDEQLLRQFTKVKRLYGQVIAASLLEKVKSFISPLQPLNIDLGNKMLILASKNDPFIPFECLQNIKRDFRRSSLEEMNYGHFPYSGNVAAIQERIRQFGEES